MDVAAPARAMRFWEEEMLGEYLAARHPRDRVLGRVRLGPLTPEHQDPTLTAEELKLLGNSFRRWADAVVVTDAELLVVEAALIPDPRDISLLETYLLLVGVTPELAAWHARPRRGLLVWAVDDAFSRDLAVRHGLAVDIFRPSNWSEWIHSKRERENRRTRPAVTLRGGLRQS